MFNFFEYWSWFKKNIKVTDLLLIGIIILAYFFTRTYNLLNLPIFTDEAIYIHWARLAWKDASWRFVSLTDGRQPLQTWGTIPFLKLFADPLFAGRMFGVSSGFLALVGIFCLAYYLYGKKFAYFATLIYLFNPYYLFYDRMALVDSAVNGFFIWFVFFGLVLVKHPRLDLALIFGLFAGLGTLAKSTVRVFFIPLAFVPIFYLKSKEFLKQSFNYFFLIGIAGVLSLVVYNVQRLSPFMHFIELKNTTFVKTLPELLSNPFDPLIHNLTTIPYYFISESNYLLFLFGFVGLILLFLHKRELAVSLTLFFLIPFAGIALMAKVVFPRYLIFLTIPFLLGFLYLLKKTEKRLLILGIYLIANAYFLFGVVKAPEVLPWPDIDRGQYLEGSSAGHGLREIVDYLEIQNAKNGQLYVFTEGTFGLLPYAMDIYFPYDQPQVKFEARWPLKEEDLAYAKELAKKYPVYFVFHEKKEIPSEWPLVLIQKYARVKAKSHVYFYKYRSPSKP
jgi:4-amino-4-deoxy-L-arabinose transferase-like glycosyltransferase